MFRARFRGAAPIPNVQDAILFSRHPYIGSATALPDEQIQQKSIFENRFFSPRDRIEGLRG